MLIYPKPPKQYKNSAGTVIDCADPKNNNNPGCKNMFTACNQKDTVKEVDENKKPLSSKVNARIECLRYKQDAKTRAVYF
jgi:hypothetical protein